MNIDVFNGDADGICALLQLRFADPVEALLVTGVKRDIHLLKRVQAQSGDQVTVLDVSLDKNRAELLALLEQQVEVFYVDHHQAGEIPQHRRLTTLIDTDANVCTSLLVDQYLQQRFSAWAVVGAFGDNLEQTALQTARHLHLSAHQLQQLRQLGTCINYNGYGASIEDLYFAPEYLYRQLSAYSDPWACIAECSTIFSQLQAGYVSDMAQAEQTVAEYQNKKVAVFVLPDAKWSRRVSGVWSNQLVNQYPERAHAVLTHNQQGGYVVSVRAPLSKQVGADQVCSRFGGGGRKTAAGINNLETKELERFIELFDRQYSSE